MIVGRSHPAVLKPGVWRIRLRGQPGRASERPRVVVYAGELYETRVAGIGGFGDALHDPAPLPNMHDCARLKADNLVQY